MAGKLQNELIRAHYWNVPIDVKAYNKALRMGRDSLNERLERRVREALLDEAFQGRRAPYHGDIFAYAMHATAACCRKCASYWYGLPRSMADVPNDEAIDYIVSIAQAYLELRMPGLQSAPVRVRGVPQSASPNPEEVDRLDRALIDSLQTHGDPTGMVRAQASALQLGYHVDGGGGHVMINQEGLDLGAA